jgi:WD40 repeat protein
VERAWQVALRALLEPGRWNAGRLPFVVLTGLVMLSRMRANLCLAAWTVAFLTASSSPCAAEPERKPPAQPAGCAVSTVRVQVRPPGALRDLRFNADGRLLAGAVLDEKQEHVDRVVFWDGRNGKEVATLRLQGHRLQDVVLSPDGTKAYVASTTEKPTYALLDRNPAAYKAMRAAYRRLVREIEIPSFRERWRRDDLEGRLKLSRDGAWLIAIDEGRVVLVSAADGKTMARFGINALRDLVLVPNTREVIAVSAVGGVQRLSIDKPTVRTTLRAAAHDQTPERLAISDDGAALATLSYGTIETLDARTAERRWSYQGHDGAYLAFHGPHLFSVHYTTASVVAVIHAADGRRLGTVKLVASRPLAVSGPGDALATPDARGGLVIRDVSLAKCSARKP